ncbi:MAG TPA: hypothetical protein VFY21_00670 [Xanthobacteraceae bacterium]|nr:hypothetical protein [Xanthobacteraceae bacterium]
MSFSPEWLRLREAADHRSRSLVLARRLKTYFSDHNAVTVYDLGSGLGSNLRGTYRWLPRRQHWVLVDYDASLLAAARDEIERWADKVSPTQGIVDAEKDGRSLKIEFRCRDLVADPAPWEGERPNLVTAAALFDLVSAGWITRFTRAVATSGAAFYTVLTHDERAVWVPRHWADADVKAAFESHFGGDKGFGASAGGDATRLIAEMLEKDGYKVERGQSPWTLGAQDRALIASIADGWAAAVRETGRVSEADLTEWLASRRGAGTECVIGHEDLLALPPRL